MPKTPHRVEIQGIKRISKPPLRKELYTNWRNLSLDNYREFRQKLPLSKQPLLFFLMQSFCNPFGDQGSVAAGSVVDD